MESSDAFGISGKRHECAPIRGAQLFREENWVREKKKENDKDLLSFMKNNNKMREIYLYIINIYRRYKIFVSFNVDLQNALY